MGDNRFLGFFAASVTLVAVALFVAILGTDDPAAPDTKPAAPVEIEEAKAPAQDRAENPPEQLGLGISRADMERKLLSLVKVASDGTPFEAIPAGGTRARLHKHGYVYVVGPDEDITSVEAELFWKSDWSAAADGDAEAVLNRSKNVGAAYIIFSILGAVGLDRGEWPDVAQMVADCYRQVDSGRGPGGIVKENKSVAVAGGLRVEMFIAGVNDEGMLLYWSVRKNR